MMRVAAVILGLLIVFQPGFARAQGREDALRAVEAANSGDNALAIFYATRVIEGGRLPAGDVAAMYAYRGNAKRHSGDHVAAIEDYGRGLEIGFGPEFGARVFNNRGLALFSLGYYEYSIEDFNEALRLAPDFSAALGNRGVSYITMGDFDAGMMDFSAAIRMDPGNTTGYNNRGRAFLGMRYFDKAIRDFTTALDLGSISTAPLFNRAMAYEGVDDRERSLDDLIYRLPDGARQPVYQEKFLEYRLLP